MAIPAVSTRVYGFPADRAARVVSRVLAGEARSAFDVFTAQAVFK